MHTPQSIIEKVREFRLQNGINQSELSAFIGFPRTRYKTWEDALTDPPKHDDRLKLGDFLTKIKAGEIKASDIKREKRKTEPKIKENRSYKNSFAFKLFGIHSGQYASEQEYNTALLKKLQEPFYLKTDKPEALSEEQTQSQEFLEKELRYANQRIADLEALVKAHEESLAIYRTFIPNIPKASIVPQLKREHKEAQKKE